MSLNRNWAVVIVVSLGVIGVIAWVGLHSFYQGSPDLLICRGEDESACAFHTNFVDCSGDMEAPAKKACRKSYNLLPAPESEAAGGKCGYRITLVICKR